MTLDGLAKVTGIGRSTISDIEKGKHIPGVDVAMEIAAALHCSVCDIFVISEKEGDEKNDDMSCGFLSLCFKKDKKQIYSILKEIIRTQTEEKHNEGKAVETSEK